jgi:tRNA-modifying protein YgfZ
MSTGSIELARTLEDARGPTFRSCPELGVVFVRGDDRVSWLNGQITNDVREIPTGKSVHALAVNVRGKIMAELYVTDLGDALLLLVPKRSQAALLESFERYIIMEDVTLEPAPELSVASVEGPLTTADVQSLTSFEYAPLGRPARVLIGDQASLDHWAEATSGLTRIDEPAYELVRLRRAVPRYGVDYDEHNYPQEVGLKALVSFKKGCYLGQEVVCTLENRGKLSKQLCVLEAGQLTPAAESGGQLYLSADAPGTDAAGAITSAVWDPEQQKSHVLAYVRRIHAQPGSTLFLGTQPLTLARIVGDDSV